jgi:hypothetical protein
LFGLPSIEPLAGCSAVSLNLIARGVVLQVPVDNEGAVSLLPRPDLNQGVDSVLELACTEAGTEARNGRRIEEAIRAEFSTVIDRTTPQPRRDGATFDAFWVPTEPWFEP